MTVELLQLGHKFNVPGLEARMFSMLWYKNSFSMENELSIYLFAKDSDSFGHQVVRERMLGIM